MCCLKRLQFSGTVVFVSHDRYFIDRLATRVLEIEGGAVTPYEGNYEDYLRRKEAAAAKPSPGAVILSDAARRAAESKDLRLPLPSRSEDADDAYAASPTNTIVIEGGYEGPDNPEPKKQARRLNPIKQKQMRDRCAFLKKRSRGSRAALHTPKSSWGSTSRLPKLST